MNNIIVKINNVQKECPESTIIGSLLDERYDPSGLPYIAALVNNDLASLSYPLCTNSTVSFLTAADSHGWRVYRRSLCFLLEMTINELFPNAVFSVEHALGPGLFCSFHDNKDNSEKNKPGITQEQLSKIKTRMIELIEDDIPIERRKIAFADALNQFEKAGLTDKLNLLKHRNPPRVVTHWCQGFSDLAHGPLALSTGALKPFDLIHYEAGFVLHLPDRADPAKLPPFADQPHLFHIFQEHKQWGRILKVNTVGSLNDIILNNNIKDFILTSEALHEKKLAEIAETIYTGRDKIKLVLIAGPSSAGKTTFAKRLRTHLRVNGLSPITMSTDDYFVGEDRNPIDADGNPDYEHIEAVDLELFNHDLLGLINGNEIELPCFNFETKKREYKGNKLLIKDKQIIIIEGIHGLNPRLTEMIPNDCEFKIFVSALTQLNLDSNNRISTTDNRLMRRMIRDSNFRGYSPLRTLQLWPSVRRGEKIWVFPFQDEAHATFNSALDYELAVLKPIAEPLLMQVKPMDKEYAEARRLSEFLLNFVGIKDTEVPGSSILREYIGNSYLSY